MIGEWIHDDALKHLVEQHVVRECVVAKVYGGQALGLSIRLGGTGARWVLMRSRRDKVQPDRPGTLC